MFDNILKYAIVVFVLSLGVTWRSAAAVPYNIDSAKRELNNPELTKENRFKILGNLSVQYYYNMKSDSGIYFAELLIKEGKADGSALDEGLGYMFKAFNLELNGNEVDILGSYTNGLMLFELADDHKNYVKCAQNLAIYLTGLGRYEESNNYLFKSLKRAEFLQNDTLSSAVNNSIGVNFLYTSAYDLSLRYFLDAKKQASSVNYQNVVRTSLSNIAIIHSRLQEYEQAYRVYLEYMKLPGVRNDTVMMANAYGQLGTIYDDLGKPDSAFWAFDKSMELAKKIHYTISIYRQLINKGDLLTSLNRLEEALTVIRLAEPYMSQFDDPDANGHFCLLKGTWNYEMAKISDTNRLLYLDSANLQFQRALKYAKPVGIMGICVTAHEMRSKIFTELGLYQLALEEYKLYTAYSDSVLNDEKIQEITRIRMNYDFEKKENELNELAATEKERKKWITIISAVLLTAAVAAWVIYKRRRDLEEKIKEARSKSDLMSSEMKALRAQMNPHFISNALNSISDYVRKNEVTLADSYLVKFSHLMRLVLENSEKSLVSIEKDMEALGYYIELEKLRLNGAFDFEILIDENVDQENTLIPPLILQPFVENSIWHGLSGLERKGNLIIHISQTNVLKIEVIDNGRGFPKEASENRKVRDSFGMKITVDRIQHLYLDQTEMASVSVEELYPGVKVVLDLPLEFAF